MGSSSDVKIDTGTGHIQGDKVHMQENLWGTQSKPTVFSELEAIEVILKVVDLLDETLHSRDIVHSNLCPEEIFLRGRSVNSMCFVGLYNCIWDA